MGHAQACRNARTASKELDVSLAKREKSTAAVVFLNAVVTIVNEESRDANVSRDRFVLSAKEDGRRNVRSANAYLRNVIQRVSFSLPILDSP